MTSAAGGVRHGVVTLVAWRQTLPPVDGAGVIYVELVGSAGEGGKDACQRSVWEVAAALASRNDLDLP